MDVEANPCSTGDAGGDVEPLAFMGLKEEKSRVIWC
jgi:hypothetical protein